MKNLKDMKDKIKAKVEKKTSGLKDKIKAKVAAKCGKACILLMCGLCAALAGCHMGEQPTAQRAQTSIIRDNVITVNVALPTNAVAESAECPAIHVEVGNLTQANETSGTETMTATPSNTPTVSTPIQVDARYNDALAAASSASKGVLEGLTAAGTNKVLELMASKETGTVEVQKKDGTTATVECKDGQCSLAGSGTCADGSCSDK